MSKQQKEAIKEFEDMLNKSKINAYSKLSLEKPLSKSGLEDWKKSIKEYYGYSDEDLNEFLKGGKKMEKTINDLPEEVLNYLWKLEYNKWADEGKERNIEEELNNFGWTLVDKSCIGDYNDLRGYLNFEIIPYEEDY